MNWRQNINLRETGANISQFLRQGKLNLVETIFLLAALVFIGIVVFYYFSKVQPLNQQVADLQNREKELRLKLDKMDAEERKRLAQIANAERILASLKKFEAALKPDERGMTQIINEIDSLGKANKIIIGDASYRVEEAIPLTDEKGNPLPESTAQQKKESIYPVMGVDTTVIGDYPNLRRFLAELERSKQFVIINSLAFQGEADKVRREAQKVGPGARVELSNPESIPVSLKIELDTYFQKPSVKTTP